MKTAIPTVNCDAKKIACDPAKPFLYILRNDLDLMQAKLGCDLEQCGVSAVMIDDKATFSCNCPAGEAVSGPAGAAITNAIYNEMGLRLRRIPFAPEAIRAAAMDA